MHVHLVHHLSVPGRLGVYEVVEDGWQRKVINAHVPFGDATEPFLQALAEAYRQMAMLAPTIIIGDMNAAPTPADRGGPATPQDHAVCDTIEMLGLVDLTADLEGQPSHFSAKQMPPRPASMCAMATPPPSSGRRPDMDPSRWDPQAIGPCTSASPSPTFPLAPPEDADQGLPPLLGFTRIGEEERRDGEAIALHKTHIRRIWRIQQCVYSRAFRNYVSRVCYAT